MVHIYAGGSVKLYRMPFVYLVNIVASKCNVAEWESETCTHILVHTCRKM